MELRIRRMKSIGYIEELESGKKIYIPIDTWKQDGKPLFGGRCVWLEKSRLLEVLER